MKIGIINSGGDAQGLNAVISAAVKYGLQQGHEFVGFIKGWEGLLDKNYIALDRERIRGISHLGGTILYTVNKGRFAGKVGSGDVNHIPDEILNQAKTNLAELGVDALIVIGGDGTLAGAEQLGKLGVNYVGVPKTIDNDLDATDATFGFHTAVDVALEALDRVHTTAYSHSRVLFVETMGRHAGWIALHAGVAGGAHIVLMPEIPFSYDKLLAFMRNRQQQSGGKYTMVVVAEGAKPIGGESLTSTTEAAEVKFGGISEEIMHVLEKAAPGEFEMRNLVLGHVQRGGAPDAYDRVLAKSYGVAAVDALHNGQFGHVVCLQGNKIVPVHISDVLDRLKTVTTDNMVFQTAQKLGIYFGN